MSIDTTVDLDIPPLRDGDRLTADEFHRRYTAMPHVRTANLVDGVVYMSSPVRNERHSDPHFMVDGWLSRYCCRLPGVRGKNNPTLRIDDDNEVQPDAMLVLPPEADGGTWSDEADYLRGVPELVVEVAASSARLDAGEKRDVYRRIGVREYVLWRVLDDRIDWWELVDGEYQPLPADAAGVVRSRVFPGLWLDVAAMTARDTGGVADAVDAGLASPDHTAFAVRLGRR